METKENQYQMKNIYAKYDYPSRLIELCEDYMKHRDSYLIPEISKLDLEHAYLRGADDAMNNITEINESIPEYNSWCLDRNFMFSYRFGDNDFELYFEKTAKLYCKLYKDLLKEITICEESSGEINNLKQKLINLENIETIWKVFYRGVSAEITHLKLTDDRLIDNSKSYEFITDEVSKEIHYLNLDSLYNFVGNKENYFIGKNEDVEKQIIQNWNYDDENKKINSINDMWLNGECVFIKIKDGIIKSWVQ